MPDALPYRRDVERSTSDLAADWVARRDAGLSEAEARQLQAWLEASPRHQVEFARWEGVWARLDQPHTSGASERLARDLSRRAQRRFRRRSALLATAAMLAVAAGAWALNLTDRVEPAAAVAVARLQQPERQTLPDGSLMELTIGTRARVEFTPEVRRIVLEAGEAHFTVVSNRAWPFEVKAGELSVKAVGTAFAVKLESAAVAVVVTEGRVAVNDGQGAAAAEPAAFLGAGEGVRVPTGAEPAAAQAFSREEAEALLSWRAPRVEFSGATLAAAVELLNEHASKSGSAVRFVVADPALARVRVSGLFRLDNSEAFVRLLEEGFGIRAERRADGEIRLRSDVAR